MSKLLFQVYSIFNRCQLPFWLGKSLSRLNVVFFTCCLSPFFYLHIQAVHYLVVYNSPLLTDFCANSPVYVYYYKNCCYNFHDMTLLHRCGRASSTFILSNFWKQHSHGYVHTYSKYRKPTTTVAHVLFQSDSKPSALFLMFFWRHTYESVFFDKLPFDHWHSF